MLVCYTIHTNPINMQLHTIKANREVYLPIYFNMYIVGTVIKMHFECNIFFNGIIHVLMFPIVMSTFTVSKAHRIKVMIQ